MPHRFPIILPDESAKPILDAIAAAKKSLLVKMFLFSDSALLRAVIAANRRGVRVRVMLNPARRDGEDTNKDTLLALERAGVRVALSNPAFGVTHEKSMVADNRIAFVNSLNWSTPNLTETRDYAIGTTHRREVGEIVSCFESDWHRRDFEPAAGSRLIWCPGSGRERVAHFIDAAKRTLFVQNERYQDAVIIERLVRAKLRGVKVHVMVRPPHTLKEKKLIEGVGGLRIMEDVGIKVHRLKHLKLHGKMLLADGVRAIVGSINIAPGSFDDRRELAIEVHDDEVVDRLHQVARHDWKHSHALDLSDAGLLKDLQDRIDDATERLALDVPPPKPSRRRRR
jgi:phosphatidylserine/phosphatidylglycerophosphate/cardiolipin synthase-like enzyme